MYKEKYAYLHSVLVCNRCAHYSSESIILYKVQIRKKKVDIYFYKKLKIKANVKHSLLISTSIL